MKKDKYIIGLLLVCLVALLLSPCVDKFTGTIEDLKGLLIGTRVIVEPVQNQPVQNQPVQNQPVQNQPDIECPPGKIYNAQGVCVNVESERTAEEKAALGNERAIGVQGYANVGPYRLLAGNSGWTYSQRIGLSESECVDLCNNNEDCKGFSSSQYSNGQRACVTYDKGQNDAPFKNQCSNAPFDYKDENNKEKCRTGINNGTLYWKDGNMSNNNVELYTRKTGHQDRSLQNVDNNKTKQS